MSRYQTFPSKQFDSAVSMPLRRSDDSRHKRRSPESGHDLPESTVQLPVARFGSVPILPPGQPIQAQGEHDTDLPGPETRRIAGQGLASASSQLPFFHRLQEAFGPHDLSGIRAHQGPAATASAQAIGAKAFASGSDVVFARPPSLFTAAHEVAHIIQQQRGVRVSGGVGARNDAYERHADQVASSVVQGKSVAGLLDGGTGSARASVTTPAASAPIQMAWEDKRLRRRAEFRPGQGRQTGFGGYLVNKRLTEGTTVSVDLDTSAAGYRPGFVQARRWIADWIGSGGHWETGYIKEDAVVTFPHEDYKKGDKYFGLHDPRGTRRQGGRYGYTSQIPTTDPRYDDADKPTVGDFVNQVGGSIVPTSAGDAALFQSFQNEAHWQSKPLPQNAPAWKMNALKARKEGRPGVGADKASKVALLAQVKTNPGKKIRFLLDGMNLNDVVTKDDSRQHYGRSITAGELRFVYRHWNSDFRGRVVFYLNDQEVPAPWDSNPTLWSQYHPKNTY